MLSSLETGLAYYFQPNRNAMIDHFGTLGLTSTGVETGLSKQDMCSEWNSRSSFSHPVIIPFLYFKINQHCMPASKLSFIPRVVCAWKNKHTPGDKLWTT